MKTYTTTAKDNVQPKWYLLDATGLVLGRAATVIAKLLLGKNKPIYAPYSEVGDCIIVVNAAKVIITGKKSSQKFYYNHSGKAGKLKQISFHKLIQKSAEELFKRTVGGMLPHGPRGRNMLNNLKVYASADHPHMAQQPVPLEAGV